MNMQQRVRAFIEARDLLRPDMTVVLGVSGGPDSLCLLDLIHALAGELRLSIHVAHLNHGLRPEAAAEAEFVRAQAEQRGLPFHTETVDTHARAAARKQSVEEAARDLRYDFLARTARSVGASVVAVAHTADDQAETVLMHFLRGTGLAGMRGMRPVSSVPSPESTISDTGRWTPDAGLSLVRPLLSTTRAEIEAYCAERKLQPRHDATNLDTTYFRNRLRHELLPKLEEYNPNIRAVLRRTAEVVAGEHEVLAGVLQVLWAQNARVADGRVTFDRLRWLTLSVPEQRALLREAVHRLLPDRRDIDFTPIDHAVQFSRSAAPGRGCDVLGGLRFLISYTTVVLAPWSAAPAADLPLLADEGQLNAGWQFKIETLAAGYSLSRREPGEGAGPRASARKDSAARLEASPAEGWGLEWQTEIDSSRLSGPLRLRHRRPGDRFRPLGLGGHTVKVADFMINEKIEEHLRDRWPLVVCGDEIVWVAGLRLDERFKITAETQSVLRLSFVREA